METDSLPAAKMKATKLRWYQYDLSPLQITMLAVIACSLLAIPYAIKMQQLRKEKDVVKAIQKLGGKVWYEGKGPPALLERRGDAFVYEVSLHGVHVRDADLQQFRELTHLDMVYLDDTSVTDAGLEYLGGMRQLSLLSLNNTDVTDAGLKHLGRLIRLSEVNVKGTQVTDQGIKDLHQSLPACQVCR